MADIRINSLPSTATSFNTDDYIAIDGASGGTRRMLAATLPLTDVTLGGTSGPSVKSTLSARAPRQGLVFNGTAGATVANVPAFGTSDLTFAWTQNIAVDATNDKFIISGAANSFGIAVFASTGEVRVCKTGVSATATGVYATTNKVEQYAYTRSGTSGKLYKNGVLAATITDSNDYSVACSQIGIAVSTTTYVPTGSLAGLLAYNRALSASEVVALYEAGAPSGADYNNATNTAFTNGTFANVGYSTFSGASATGFVATYGGGGEAAATSQIASLAVAPGRKYLIKFDLTLTSGTAPYVGLAQFGVQWLTGSAAVTTGQVRATAGANSIVVTIRSVNTTFATGAGIGFASQEASSFTVSNLTATPLGLLLAPDAAQAGGGLVWYDTSGNAANITLPASGVSWNVPTSGIISAANGSTTNPSISFASDTGTGFWRQAAGVSAFSSGGSLSLYFGASGVIAGTAGTNNLTMGSSGAVSLTAGGTNQNITLTPSGTGRTIINANSLALNVTGTNDTSVVYGRFGTSGSTGQLFVGVEGSVAGILNTGTLAYAGYIGTASSGTALQLATAGGVRATITSGGNYLIGTTTDGGQKLQVSGEILSSPSGAGYLVFTTHGSKNTGLYYNGSQGLVLYTNQLTALTLDSSQNATFAGQVNVNKAANGYDTVKLTGASGNHVGTQFVQTSVATWSLYNTATTGNLSLNNGGVDALVLAKTTGDATFAGKTYTAAGAAATPAISFSGDTDSGFYSAAGNQVSLACGGAQIWNTTVNGLSMALGKDIYLGNAYQAGAPTATGYLTIKDSNGNAYKIPVVAV